MRLRLLIERNELPPSQILWSIPSTQLTQTIAHFLSAVNIRFPLEGNTWGLEDYSVTISGYEAQHYSVIGEVFKEDDEVVIKPLQFAEQRARSIAGRSQITQDGRRLVDGVPFGKPLLKRMRRPDVDIPPAKRVRIEGEENENENFVRGMAMIRELMHPEGGHVDDAEIDAGMGMIREIMAGEDDDDEDDEDDGDFEAGDEDEESQSASEDDDELSEKNDSSADDMSVDDQDPKNLSNDANAFSEEDDDDDSSDSDSSSDASSSSSSSEDSDSDSDSESDSDDSDGSNVYWHGTEASNNDKATSAEAASDNPIPHEGKTRTKARNIRRRETAQLKHLIRSGELPEGTTLKQMQEWLKTGELPNGSDASDSHTLDTTADQEASKEQDTTAQEIEEKRQQLIDNINGGGIDVSAPLKKLDAAAAAAIPANMAPPQAKKSKKKQNKTSAVPDDDRPEELPIATEPVVVLPTTIESTDPPAPSAASTKDKPEGPTRVSAAHRLIYGSLGLKAPRSQADKDALQKKLADRSRKSVEAAAIAEQAEAEDEDPEAWRKQVEISAIECVDDGVVLSEPPFPFQQRWDPQYWKQNVKKRGAGGAEGGKEKKRKGNKQAVVETYDKYNQDGGGDALDYDDPVDDEEDEEWDDGEDWQEGALLVAEEEDEDDGFPPLPDNVDSLPPFAEEDAKVGEYVVFTEMACSDATGWQPQMVTKRGRLTARNGETWSVQFPKQKKAIEYDDQGNRIYKKFEMEGYDEEDNVRDMNWVEMADVKFLAWNHIFGEQETATAENVEGSEGVEKQIQSQLEGEMGKEATISSAGAVGQ